MNITQDTKLLVALEYTPLTHATATLSIIQIILDKPNLLYKPHTSNDGGHI